MKKNYITLKSIAFINKVFILFLLSAISNNLYAQNSDCNATLKVLNNETSKKASDGGADYRLKLTNTGNDKTTFNLTVKNIGLDDSFNKDSKEIGEVKLKSKIYSSNVNKTFSLKKTDTDSFYTLTLDKNESVNFVIKLSVPTGTKIGSKNKSKLNITTEKCKNFSVNTILNTIYAGGE